MFVTNPKIQSKLPKEINKLSLLLFRRRDHCFISCNKLLNNVKKEHRAFPENIFKRFSRFFQVLFLNIYKTKPEDYF